MTEAEYIYKKKLSEVFKPLPILEENVVIDYEAREQIINLEKLFREEELSAINN